MNVRLTTIRYIWTANAIAMALLFISSIFSGGLSVAHVILGVVIALVAFVSTAVVWGDDPETDTAAAAKAKRSRVDVLLDNLSDEDLDTLRERLIDRSADDSYGVGDDGELVRRR